jgi:hypothetical protein
MVHRTGVPLSCRRRLVSKAALGLGLRQDDGRADVSYNRAFIALAATGTECLSRTTGRVRCELSEGTGNDR